MNKNGSTVEQQMQQLVAAARAEGRAEATRELQDKMATFAADFVQKQAQALGLMTPVPQPIAPPSVQGKPVSHGKAMHPHCIYPGCKDANTGPKFHWLCQKHRPAWKAEKKMLKKAMQADVARASA